MKRTSLLLSILVLTACNTKSVDPVGSKGNINSSAPYLWASSAFPRNLKISNDFSDAEVTNIKDMSAAWETALENKKNFFSTDERTTEVSSANMNLDSLGNDSVNGVYKIRNWPRSLSTMALAVTQLFGRRFNVGSANEYVRIEHADVLINENLYDFRTDDNETGWNFDLQTVVLHELGHFLGLGHKSGNTVMVPSIGPGSEGRAPTGVDITDMATKYSVTLTTPVSSSIAAGPLPNYVPNGNDQGEEVRILIELHANGNCVHRENGKIVYRH